MATVETQLYTAEEFWEWINRPENQKGRYELVQGEIIDMPPPGELHGILCAWIASLFWQYVIKRGQGGVASNDTGFLVERDPDTVRGPDVMVFDESKKKEDLNKKFVERIPKLIVEVLSPHDRTSKTIQRVHQYFGSGVPLVWLVDPETNMVTAHRPGKEPEAKTEKEEISAEDVLPNCKFRVADFFKLPGT
jgi:Uma2 family endonuclease